MLDTRNRKLGRGAAMLGGASLLCALSLGALLPATAMAQDRATIDRGRGIFKDIAVCAYCHSWTGKGERVEGLGWGASLVDSKLSKQDMIDVTRCGRPGTFMPRHARDAWNAGKECYGMNKEQIGAEMPNAPEKAYLSDEQIAAVIEYVFAVYVGKPMTVENCVAYNGPTSRVCEEFKK